MTRSCLCVAYRQGKMSTESEIFRCKSYVYQYIRLKLVNDRATPTNRRYRPQIFKILRILTIDWYCHGRQSHTVPSAIISVQDIVVFLLTLHCSLVPAVKYLQVQLNFQRVCSDTYKNSGRQKLPRACICLLVRSVQYSRPWFLFCSLDSIKSLKVAFPASEKDLLLHKFCKILFRGRFFISFSTIASYLQVVVFINL